MKVLVARFFLLIILIGTTLSCRDSSGLPTSVKNECKVLIFNEKYPHLARVEASVSIDLKNSSGGVEEKAWINLYCSAKHPANSYDLSKAKMECQGVRLMGRDEEELRLYKLFEISTGNVKVFPKLQKVEVVWQSNSKFTIQNEKYFTWEMGSQLSGKSHKGKSKCN